MSPKNYFKQSYKIVNNLNCKKRVPTWISFDSSSCSTGSTHENYVIKDDYLFGHPEISFFRCGDSPSWLGIRKTTRIELNGKRHNSLKTIPRLHLELFKKYSPQILNTPYNALEKYKKSTDSYLNYKPWYERLVKFY